jgi:hypothetical protein
MGRREKWLFRPARRPQDMQGLPEAAKPSELDAAPFEWTPQQPSPYEFELVDGIFRVYEGKRRDEEAFPLPGDSYDFFSDMHWCAHTCPCFLPHNSVLMCFSLDV